MKKLDRVILALFSVLMFLQSILAICIIAGFVRIETVTAFATMAFSGEQTTKIILGLEIVCLLCSIKCIFFDSSEKENKAQGVLMQNDNGKLLISKPTIENIVKSVVKDFASVEDVSVDIDLDTVNNLIVNVNLVVGKDVIIKEITLNMQNRIKEKVKQSADLEVKEVNVKIKNISSDTAKEN